MNRPDFELFMGKLGPVAEAIERFDKVRPLNLRARNLQGIPGSLRILRGEGAELAAALHKNNPHDIREEAGDVMFGLADYWRRRGGQELSLAEFMMLGGWVQLSLHTSKVHGVDLIEAGVHVNGDKNPRNNPVWAFKDCDPLDNPTRILDVHDEVRRGLRVIRDMDSQGKLRPANLEVAINFMGYTQQALAEQPVLASAFLRQVAVRGLVL